MSIELFSLYLYWHYLCVDILHLEYADWAGSLLYLQWDDEFMWDFLFLNSSSDRPKG